MHEVVVGHQVGEVDHVTQHVGDDQLDLGHRRAIRVSRPGSSISPPVWKVAIRTCPPGRSMYSRHRPSARSTATAISVAVSASARPAAVSATPRPAGSIRVYPASFSSTFSCWETADGVICIASATAPTVPRSDNSLRSPSRRTSM